MKEIEKNIEAKFRIGFQINIYSLYNYWFGNRIEKLNYFERDAKEDRSRAYKNCL